MNRVPLLLILLIGTTLADSSHAADPLLNDDVVTGVIEFDATEKKVCVRNSKNDRLMVLQVDHNTKITTIAGDTVATDRLTTGCTVTILFDKNTHYATHVTCRPPKAPATKPSSPDAALRPITRTEQTSLQPSSSTLPVHAPPYLNKDTFTAKLPAHVKLGTGQVFDGTMTGVTDSQIKWRRKRNGHTVDLAYKLENVASIEIGDYVYKNVDGKLFSVRAQREEGERNRIAAEEQAKRDLIAAAEKRRAEQEQAKRDRIAAESALSGRIKIVNNTGKTVEFAITRYRDQEGNEIVLDNGRSKSNLEEIGGVLQILASSGKQSTPVPKRWDIKPGQTTFLSSDQKPFRTSKVHYSLSTSDGSKSWSIEKKHAGDDFAISIDASDLHSPVLATVGEWQLDQDISYSTHRARSPTTISPVRGFFSNDIKYWEVNGGDEYEYTQVHKSGVATAWATVKNPTNSTLTVTAVLEFHFAHLLLSHERVEATITVEPKTSTKMYVTVNTKAIIGNRKATGLRLMDITTTRK